jgi:hypothetical protein
MKLLKTLCSVFIVSVLLNGCAGKMPTQEELNTQSFEECPQNYQAIIQAYFNSVLIDPQSAIYQFVEPYKYVYKDQYVHRVTMAVNSKNRFGGYVGAQRYNFICLPDSTLIRDLD